MRRSRRGRPPPPRGCRRPGAAELERAVREVRSSSAARIEADDVEALAEACEQRLGGDHEIDAGAAGTARVDEQHAPPARRERAGADGGERESLAVGMRVVDRHRQLSALQLGIAGTRREREPARRVHGVVCHRGLTGDGGLGTGSRCSGGLDARGVGVVGRTSRREQRGEQDRGEPAHAPARERVDQSHHQAFRDMGRSAAVDVDAASR